ncbi:MAG TPA: DUF4339 domain-containing protein [Nannocystaceae bacterium]|nr:DUF4339 domain-containing protein [Nannocystaceae bacterium]
MLALALALPCVPSTAYAWPTTPAKAKAADDGWYYAIDGRTQGPLDDAAFAEAYLVGSIGDATPVWWEGADGWRPLAQSQRFAELDRWYIRRGDKEIGPMTAAALREQLAKARSEGKPYDSLDVRLEHSRWVAVTAAAPLREPDAPPADQWQPPPSVVAGPSAAPAPAVTASPSATSATPPSFAATDADSEELASAKRMRMGGLITFGIGGSFIVIGGGIAGGYSTGAVGAKALWAGVGLAAFGVVPTIIGGAIYGAAKRKVSRLERGRLASLRVAPLAGRGTGGLMLGGRF